MWIGIIGGLVVLALWVILVIVGAIVSFSGLRGDKSPRQRTIGWVALVITIFLALGLAYIVITSLVLSSEAANMTF
ncbi:MAG: hypothetical protein AAF125_13100 [Chloroflexota bacterium]